MFLANPTQRCQWARWSEQDAAPVLRRQVLTGFHAMKVLRSSLFVLLVLLLTAANAHGFKFDLWIAGVSLHEAYNIAKYQNIKLRKSDYTGTRAQPLLSKEYDDSILGEPVEVVLFFTPISKKLFRVYVTWNRSPDTKKISDDKIDGLYNELARVLSDKYKKGSSIPDSSFETKFECSEPVVGVANQLRIKRSKYTVDLLQSVPCNWLTITYKDAKLSQINYLEIQRKQQVAHADYKKF